MKPVYVRFFFFLGFGYLLAVGCNSKAPPAENIQSADSALRDTSPAFPGAIIHSLVPKGPGEIYGLQEGDILIGWEQDGESGGSIESPFQARYVEAHVAPKGNLQLKIFRQGDVSWITTASGRWEIELRLFDPRLSAPGESRTHDSLDGSPTFEEQLDSWQGLVREAQNKHDHETSRWYQFRVSQALAKSQQPELAADSFQQVRSDHGVLEPTMEAIVYEQEGIAWAQAGYKGRAERAFLQALEIQKKESPTSVAVANNLVHLAELAPFSQRKPYLLEAQALLKEQAPKSVEQAYVLNHLGIVAWEVDRRIDQAIDFYTQALDLRQNLIPGSYWIGGSFRNLAACARLQGRLDEAEVLIKKSIAAYPKVPRFAGSRAGAFNTLGLIQRDKGSYRQARENWETALSLYRDLNPEGRAVAGISNNLGNLSLRVGDLDRAQDRYLESLELRRKLFPEGSASIADSMNNLGIIAKEQGRFAEAQNYFARALGLKRQFVPDSLSFANTLQNIGSLALTKGHPDEAIPTVRQALTLRRKIAPRSTQTAESLILLGRAMVQTGQFSPGIQSWREGIDLLDETRDSFRFSAQERSIFASRFQDHYRDLAANLAVQGKTVEAFNILERSRARALRMMAFQELPASPIGENPMNWAELPAFQWAEIRNIIDPGTALIMFSVGEDQTLIIVATNPRSTDPHLGMHRVAIDRETWVQKVDLFRTMLARGRTQRQIEKAVVQQAKSLFDLLLAPVDQLLVHAERLLIIPDRPLGTLPFAALVRTEDPTQFIGQWKPLSFAVSGTTFALSVRRRTPKPGQPTLTVYAHSKGQSASNTDSPALIELPGVKMEAQLIARRFGGRSKVLVDEAASETAFKDAQLGEPSTVSAHPHYLHFATHALTDNRDPLNSSLVLEPGREDDGLLSANEIIESLRVNSDLVTLSACETGLGRDLGGEGVLGLSHAFLFSGARSILTSLWQVSDTSTAHWMETFYASLLAGKPSDQAVMDAQLRIMESEKDTLHPYYWSAFQLWGDWAPSVTE